MLIDQSEEVITNVGLDIPAVGWVEPYEFSLPFPLAIFDFRLSMRKVLQTFGITQGWKKFLFATRHW